MTLLHIGDHSLLKAGETAAHLLQPVHLGFLVIAVVAVILAFRARRKKLMRVPVRTSSKEPSHDPR